jgi:hypothetical protein
MSLEGNSLSLVYSGQPKLLLAGSAANRHGAALASEIAHCYEVVPGAEGGIALRGEDGTLDLLAPPAGICVIACTAQDRALAEQARAIWSGAKLPEPPVVELPEEASGEEMAGLRARLALTFAEAAIGAHEAACREAVSLDRQIAALREQLEDSRNKWQDCAATLQAVTGGLPVMGFATRNFSGRVKLEPGTTLSQVLPFAAAYAKAVAVHVAVPTEAPGQLRARVMANEDDVVLSQVEDLGAMSAGWVTLDLPANIPWRYRNLRLVLDWTGAAEDAPELSVARAAGMDRYFLHQDAEPLIGTRLGMRAWAGSPDTPPTELARATEIARAETRRSLALKVGGEVLRAHEKLVERDLGEWPWVAVKEDGILVHPTLAGPSVVGVEMNGPYPIQGVQALCVSPNAGAPAIEFLLAVFPADAPLELDSAAPDPLPLERALGYSEWLEVLPGSSAPISARFPATGGPVKTVLATQVRGDSVGHAHGWFRDIRIDIHRVRPAP